MLAKQPHMLKDSIPVFHCSRAGESEVVFSSFDGKKDGNVKGRRWITMTFSIFLALPNDEIYRGMEMEMFFVEKSACQICSLSQLKPLIAISSWYISYRTHLFFKLMKLQVKYSSSSCSAIYYYLPTCLCNPKEHYLIRK